MKEKEELNEQGREHWSSRIVWKEVTSNSFSMRESVWGKLTKEFKVTRSQEEKGTEESKEHKRRVERYTIDALHYACGVSWCM